ncbi:MAG TPA: hypothetical protein VK610_01375 [Rhodothermales bacterium]|nr:hypothetical protein [Rhodothermales bacterium]
MTRFFFLSLALTALAGCVTPAAPVRPANTAPLPGRELDVPPSNVAPEDDVRLGGLSLIGTWAAIEVVGDAEATNDLDRGQLTQTLLIRPRGNAVLTGVDRRASGEPVAFGGEVRGSVITFVGMSGTGRLSVEGRRLHLLDPRGRTTVFARVGR